MRHRRVQAQPSADTDAALGCGLHRQPAAILRIPDRRVTERMFPGDVFYAVRTVAVRRARSLRQSLMPVRSQATFRIRRKIEPDAAWHPEERLPRVDILRRRLATVLGRKRVGASQERCAAARPPSGGSSPEGTLAHNPCHSVAGRSGITSVVSGPPPRTDVRCPAPPAGAMVCSVSSAIAAARRERTSTRPGFTKSAAFFVTVAAPGASINRASTAVGSVAKSSKS